MKEREQERTTSRASPRHLPEQSTPADSVLQLQRYAGNAAVQRLLSDRSADGQMVLQRQKVVVPKEPPKVKNPIQSEDVAGIITEHMERWFNGCRWGIEKANLSGPDDALKWFLVALGGNLVWAATAFVNPAAAIAIRVMSVAGATVGSGTLATLAAEDKPIDEFKSKAVEMFDAVYRKLAVPDLTRHLQREFYEAGLFERDDAEQAEARRALAWKLIFKDRIPYKDHAAIEALAKRNIEAIWRQFLPGYKSLYTLITPNFIRKDRAYYVLVEFIRALVSSGVADQLEGVRTYTDLVEDFEGDFAVAKVYEFPGGAKAFKTGVAQHLWWGNLTATVPR